MQQKEDDPSWALCLLVMTIGAGIIILFPEQIRREPPTLEPSQTWGRKEEAAQIFELFGRNVDLSSTNRVEKSK